MNSVASALLLIVIGQDRARLVIYMRAFNNSVISIRDRRCIVDFRGLKQVALPELAELSYDKLTGKTVTFAASRAAETEVVRWSV
eukprot:28257-Eustigmatos_ZCMA.PRE.1